MNNNISDNKSSELDQQILQLISESISKRKNSSIELNDIMEYDSHRPDINQFDKVDFIIDGSRGSVCLLMGDLLTPEDFEKMKEKNLSFFKKKSE